MWLVLKRMRGWNPCTFRHERTRELRQKVRAGPGSAKTSTTERALWGLFGRAGWACSRGRKMVLLSAAKRSTFLCFVTFRSLVRAAQAAKTSCVCATYVEIAAPPLPGYDSSAPASAVQIFVACLLEGFCYCSDAAEFMVCTSLGLTDQESHRYVLLHSQQ